MKRLARAIGAAIIAAAPTLAHAVTFSDIVDPSNPSFTQALGVNNAGTIVGYGNATTFNGFELNNGILTRQNVAGADGGTQVTGISGAGTTVGFSITGGVTSGFTQSGGTFTPVNQPGAVFTQLLGINQAGTQIAGYSSFTDILGATGQQAFLLVGATYTNINALLPANLNSQATGVNNNGEVVGFYQLTPNTNPTFDGFTDINGTIASLVFPNAVSTQALGVNDLGQIVGDYVDAGGIMHGFLDSNGNFLTLDPSGSTGTTINGINDGGTVVGFYTNGPGATIGTVGTIPEPASLLLIGTALLALGVIRRAK